MATTRTLARPAPVTHRVPVPRQATAPAPEPRHVDEPRREDVHLRVTDLTDSWRVVASLDAACAWRITNLDGALEARWAGRDNPPAIGRGAYSSLPSRSYDTPMPRVSDLYVSAPSGSPAIEIDACYDGCLVASRGQRGSI